jgi:uncharacterized protein (DUF2267 family)
MSQVRIAQEPSLAELLLLPEGQIPSWMLRGMIPSGGRNTRHIRCGIMLPPCRIPQLASCVKPPTHFCQSVLERLTAHRVGFMSIRSLGRFPMSATGLDVFDKTLQTTHIWLDELMVEIGSDRQAAWHVLGTVLRAVRDRIPLELAVHLGSQLPLLVRGLYYDQWHAPGRMDEKPRSLDAFLEPIREQLARIRPIDAGNATQAVFRILSRHVNPGQIEKVKHALPGEVQAIWIEVTPDTQVEVERAITRGDDAATGGGRA